MAPKTHTFRSTFALIIGINEYAAPENPPLAGCVGDATRFNSFLTDDCGVPRTQIRLLMGNEATRRNIMGTFLAHFTNNQQIPADGALMIFYFAGHGSFFESPSSQKKIETICPYDERTGEGDQLVYGIPDYVLGWLLEDLSQKKGTNITVILDACHSGGMGRDADSGTIRRTSPTTPVPVEIDMKLWKNRTTSELFSTWHSSSSSHTLLAACRADEFACEAKLPDPTNPTSGATQVMGRFTTSLLLSLRKMSDNLSNTTYSDLLQSLDAVVLNNQHPHCGEMNQDWLVFTNTKPSLSWGLVQNSLDPDTFRVDIGSFWGITHDTEFSLIACDGELVGALNVKDLRPDYSNLFLKGQTSIQLDGHRVRVAEWKNPSMILLVFVNNNFPYMPELAYMSLKSAHNLVLTEKAKANIILRECGENPTKIMIEWQTGSITQYAKQNTLTLKDTEYLPDILDGIAHFNYVLNHNGGTENCNIDIQLKLYQLMGRFGERKPNPDVGNIVQDNVARLAAERGKKYAFEMCNESPQDLFPYLFYLNPQTYQISALYLPPGSNSKPSLSSGKTIQLGSGNERAFEFKADPSSMIGFLKMFVFSDYQHLDWIPQNSLLDQSRAHGNGRSVKREHVELSTKLGKAIQVAVIVTQ
ncbi:caspase domain-containing protein [Mycena epipterygia]|nr:caspase domain-containing protein [Mycena epipterygia]